MVHQFDTDRRRWRDVVHRDRAGRRQDVLLHRPCPQRSRYPERAGRRGDGHDARVSPTASNARDFNHDDVQDLLFQSTAGDLYAWNMNGTSVVSGAWLSPARLDPEWRVVAARDFTGDGRPDLQLRNQSTVSARIRQIVSLVMVYEQDCRLPPPAEPSMPTDTPTSSGRT
jgi:hypothetical protein